MNASGLRPGEILLRDATRSFSIRADQARTFKGLLIGARAQGPPPVPALRGVTLHIEPGETVGMVGRNGAGKTSTLRVLAGIVPLQSGVAASGGRMVSLLELGSGFSRDFSGRENVYLQGALYGFTKAQIDDRIERIIAFSELGDFIEVPVKTYSAGMFLRLGFSIAAFLDADVLLIDEILAVGDEGFQRKCLRRISEQIASGTTVVLVSHDARAVERVCERVVVLDAGRVVFDGPTAEGLLHYHRLMGTEHGGGESIRPGRARAIEVADVELRDGAGRASTVFRTGSAMHIAVELRARAPVTRPELALEIRAGEGRRVFATSTEIAPNREATTRLLFEIPALALLGGDYDVSLAAGGRGVDPAEDRTVGFSVAAEPGAEGIVDLRGRWRTLEPARVAP
ncbi:MAG TPA: ABC transporter ATP-binding protein [Solirubrobacteraceae bacterium]|jgi:ABC-type polysaccharide/polyol phosphate transport system ATPase subunit|nr:ABC transporter ATP-binding protein [Solirubrobacteraceae bacterium]